MTEADIEIVFPEKAELCIRKEEISGIIDENVLYYVCVFVKNVFERGLLWRNRGAALQTGWDLFLRPPVLR